MTNIKIDYLTEADEVEALKHMREQFSIDEPLISSIQFEDVSECDDLYIDLFKNGLCIKAVNEEGKIIGLFLGRQLFRMVNSFFLLLGVIKEIAILFFFSYIVYFRNKETQCKKF